MTRAAGVRQSLTIDRILLFIVLSGAGLMPLVISPSGSDSFRLPKLLLLRLEAIALIATLSLDWLWRINATRTWFPHRQDRIICYTAVAWTGTTTLCSSLPLQSLRSFLTLICGLAIFVASVRVAPLVTTKALYVLFASALINVFVYLLQIRGIWVTIAASRAAALNDIDRLHLAEAGLLGNRDDIGTALILPALLACTLALQRQKERRWIPFITAILLVAGLIATRTLASICALAVGVTVLLLVRFGARVALIPILAGGIAAGAALALYAPFRYRISNEVSQLRAGDLDSVLSGRLIAYRAALRMFGEHPFLGVGPGRFDGEFFDHAVTSGRPGPGVTFGEAHNDHLQILAETGCPGYAIFAAAVISLSFMCRGPRRDLREAFSRDAALPLAAGFLVSALAQFPLHLATTIATLATTFGLLRGWTTNR